MRGKTAMETGSIGKTAAATVPTTAPRMDLASSGAVATELAPEAAVRQVGPAQAVQVEPSDGAQRRAVLDAALREVIKRNIVVDPKSREVVFQTVDERTGEVVRQIPDDTMLRLRAYAREMRDRMEPRENGLQVGKIA